MRRLSPVINGLDVQFQCRLFCMHRQMSFGVPAVLLEALCALPGGIGRFLPCRIGANHCRDILCVGHGLTSRPEDTSSVCFLAELLVLFGYPSILVMRCLPLRYCSKQVASRVSSWRLPLWCNVADLATEGGEGSELFVLLHALDVDAVADIRTGGARGDWRAWRASEESPTQQNNSRASCVTRCFGFAISSPVFVRG